MRIGIRQAKVSEYESGAVGQDLTLLRAMEVAAALGASVKEVFYGLCAEAKKRVASRSLSPCRSGTPTIRPDRSQIPNPCVAATTASSPPSSMNPNTHPVNSPRRRYRSPTARPFGCSNSRIMMCSRLDSALFSTNSSRPTFR